MNAWVEINLTVYVNAETGATRYEPHYHPHEDSRKGAVRLWPDDDGAPDLEVPLQGAWHKPLPPLDDDLPDIAWGATSAPDGWLPLDEDGGPEFGW